MITLAIWARLEMLPPKKMTPPTSPCRIQLSSVAGGVEPGVAVDHPLAGHLRRRERRQGSHRLPAGRADLG